MLVQKVGDWAKVRKILSAAPQQVQRALKDSLRREAEFIKAQIIRGIKDQAPGGKSFLPLAETTLAVRKFKNFSHTKALIKSANLIKGIHVFEEKDSVFIGVRRTRKEGGATVDVAMIQEYGSGPIVIQVTDKMRKFLFAAFKAAGISRSFGSGTGIIVTKVPARPFVRPTFAKYQKEARQRIEKQLQELLGKALS